MPPWLSLFLWGVWKHSLSSASNVFTGPGNTVSKMRAVTFCVVLSNRNCSTSYQLDRPCFMSAGCHRFFILDRFIPFSVMGSVLETISAQYMAISRVHPWMCCQLITGPNMRNQRFSPLMLLRQYSKGVRTPNYHNALSVLSTRGIETRPSQPYRLSCCELQYVSQIRFGTFPV